MGFNKILIIKLGAIGDLLMATPAVRALKKAYPTAHISLLVGKSSKMAVSGNPHIDEFIECDDYIIYKGTLLQKLKYILSLILKIKRKKYDVVFVFHRDWRFNLFAFLCGIPERVGFDRNGEGRFLTKKVRISGVKHNIDHYLDVVNAFGVQDDGKNMEFTINREAEIAVDKILEAWDLKEDDIKVGILAGGASNIKSKMLIKRWPLEYYVELTKKMVSGGYKVILLGANSDKPGSKVILKSLSDNIFDLTGKTTLEETAAVMKKCKVIVTHDSGPMHLASAVGRPVVSIFGPTDPREYYPLNRNSHYFWNVGNIDCAPCYSEGEFPDCKDPRCINAVSVEEVYNKMLEILKHLE